MPKQHSWPREEFLAKLNTYLAAYIAGTSRAGAKTSRTEIARRLGDYHRTTLHNWLNGSAAMPRKVVDKFCTLVGLTDQECHELLELGGYIEFLPPSPSAQNADAAPPGSAAPLPSNSAEIHTAIISTTLDHLPLYRPQVVEACLRQGLLPAHPSVPVDVVSHAGQMYIGIYPLAEGGVPMGFEVEHAQAEYDFFVRQGIARVIVIASVSKGMTGHARQQGNDTAEWQHFRTRLEAENTVSRVEQMSELRAEIIDRLRLLRQVDEAAPHYVRDIPERPCSYIAHPYVFLQTKTLVGRHAELEALTAWAGQPGASHKEARVFTVVAVGGMGKSAMTWTWFNEIAPATMPSLAGQVWWSFYESDATFENFILRTLAYATRTSPEALERDLVPAERENLLLSVLDREPFLIVLDGLERLLIAYARIDASRLADEALDAQTANSLDEPSPLSAVGLPAADDRNRLRKTIDPRVGRFLRRLTTVHTSRTLISSRLYPADLQTSTGGPLPGSAAYFLSGLRGIDSVRLWRSLGVSGSGDQLLPLFDTIGHHPLLIQALARTIAHDRKAPGDFDQWRHHHPDFNPFGLPIAERKTHVLEYALRGLDQPNRHVLQTAAAFRMPIAYAALATLFIGVGKLFRLDHELDTALTDLEDRGLLGWDKYPANRYDLHPLVRGVVWTRMDSSRQRDAYEALHAYFGSVAHLDDWQQVHQLDELTSTIELYNVLIGLGRYDEAWDLFSNQLGNALLYRLSANRQRAELLELLFPDGLDQPPPLSDPFMGVYTCSALVQSYGESGQCGRAVTFFRQHQENLQEEIGMVNLGDTLWLTGQLFDAELEAYNALYDSRELGMLFHEALSLRLCGWILVVRGQLDVGQRTLRRAARIFAEEGAPQFEGATYAYLAQAAIWAENYDEAWAYAERAAQLAEAELQERDFTRVDRLRGTILLYQDRITEAEEVLEQALMRARRSNIIEEEILSLMGIASLRLYQGDRQAAYEILDEVWEPVERGPYPLYYADALNLLAQLEYERNVQDAAAVAAGNAYQEAWCDGPPYAYHWGLQAAQDHLARLRGSVPSMRPFDESRIDAMPLVELEPPDEESETLDT